MSDQYHAIENTDLLDNVPEILLKISATRDISNSLASPLDEPRGTDNGTTEFPASDRRRQAVLADRNLLIHDLVRETVLTPGHGSDKDCDRVRLGECGHVVAQFDWLSVGRQGCHTVYRLSVLTDRRPETHARLTQFDTLGRKVVGDGSLDTLQQLVRPVVPPDRMQL